MKFFDNIMRAIGLKEEEDNEFEFDDEKKDNVVPMFGTKSYGSESHRGYETNRYEESRHTGRDNLIAMPHAQKSVSIVEKMADYLRNNQPVVINFENTDNDVRKRIVDFISGTIYALDGSLRKVGRNIMVCAPQNVEIDVENTNYTSESEAEPWER